MEVHEGKLRQPATLDLTSHTPFSTARACVWARYTPFSASSRSGDHAGSLGAMRGRSSCHCSLAMYLRMALSASKKRYNGLIQRKSALIGV
jgi:hypothetical protein